MSAVAEQQTAGGAADEREARDSSPTSEVRGYVVLEEPADLAELVVAVLAAHGMEDVTDHVTGPALAVLRDQRAFRPLGTFEGRNQEHALRRAAKAMAAAEGEGGEFNLVSVAAKMWRPTPVRVRATQTVAIG